MIITRPDQPDAEAIARHPVEAGTAIERPIAPNETDLRAAYLDCAASSSVKNVSGFGGALACVEEGSAITFVPQFLIPHKPKRRRSIRQT